MYSFFLNVSGTILDKKWLYSETFVDYIETDAEKNGMVLDFESYY